MYQFLDKTDNFEFLGPNLPKNRFWGRNSKSLNLHSESPSLRYNVYQFSDKTDNFEFLGANLPKTGFGDQSLDSESASLRYYVYQFSDKTDNFEFLGLNLPKIGFWDQNFKNLSLDSASLRYYVYQFLRRILNFWAQICPKMDFWVGISKIQVCIWNQHLQYTMCANFQSE